MLLPDNGALYRSARSAYGMLCEGLAATMLRSEPVERAVLNVVARAGDTRVGSSLQARLASGLRRRLQSEPQALRWARLVNGAWLRVDVRTYVGAIYFGKDYEAPTTQAVLGWLAPGDVFVDIGANSGYFTMLAGKRVGDSGRVVAIEANPRLVDRLLAAVARNGFQSVQVIHAAVTDRDEPILLYLSNDPTNDGISSTVPWQGHLSSGDLSAANTVEVRGMRFDALELTSPLPRIDLLKIDVEGAELRVLQGMSATFDRTPPRRVVCETSLRSDVTDWLTARGYRAEPLEYLKPEYEWGNILYTLR